jgi:hypothetical protein
MTRMLKNTGDLARYKRVLTFWADARVELIILLEFSVA